MRVYTCVCVLTQMLTQVYCEIKTQVLLTESRIAGAFSFKCFRRRLCTLVPTAAYHTCVALLRVLAGGFVCANEEDEKTHCCLVSVVSSLCAGLDASFLWTDRKILP